MGGVIGGGAHFIVICVSSLIHLHCVPYRGAGEWRRYCIFHFLGQILCIHNVPRLHLYFMPSICWGGFCFSNSLTRCEPLNTARKGDPLSHMHMYHTVGGCAKQGYSNWQASYGCKKTRQLSK